MLTKSVLHLLIVIHFTLYLFYINHHIDMASSRTRITTIRISNDLYNDLVKVSNLHFGGNTSKAINTAIGLLIERERKVQNILSSKL